MERPGWKLFHWALMTLALIGLIVGLVRRRFEFVVIAAIVIVVTAMHPAMFLKGVSVNFRDESGEVRPRSYVATLSDYVMGAVQAGLVIVSLAEHSVDEGLAARNERSRKWLGWPALFVMTLKRAPR